MSTGIVLATYGEPTRNSFADQWMYSYRILRGLTRKIAKIPGPLLPVIATARARGRVRLWSEHRFASPLEPLHERTAAALQTALTQRGITDAHVIHAYEFRRPGMAEAFGALRARACDRLVIVPMYIADGDFTNGMTRRKVDDALRRGAWRDPGAITYCGLSAGDADTLLLASALARHCREHARERGVPAPARDWALLLAAHGTVVNPPAGVDNGLIHAARVLLRLKSLLKPHFGLVRIGWLNHTRGGKWTSPAVPDLLPRIQQRGFTRLVYFPWGFTTDNAETALEGRVAVAGLERPFERVEHLECMNTAETFIGLLADRVAEHLSAAPAATEVRAHRSANVA
jgi:protoheme ferro-lyase